MAAVSSLARLLNTRSWREDGRMGGSRRENESVKPPAVKEACLVLDAPTGSENILDARREEELSQEAAGGEP